MTGLTYLQFHLGVLVMGLLWLVPVTAILRRRTRRPLWEGREYWLGVAIVATIALLYTIPWDNYLIARGVWWYGENRVLAHLWLAPVEEYLFILAQPFLTALWASHLSIPEWREDPVRVRPRIAAGAVALAIGAVGAAMLLTQPTVYLGAILVWAAPVFLLQWVVGAPQLLVARRTLMVGTLVPTVYLWVADWIAIDQGIWVFSGALTTGVSILGLPVEEAVFFLVTNLFVVQGLVLYRWVLDRWGFEAIARSVRGRGAGFRGWVVGR